MSRHFFALWPDAKTRDRLIEVCHMLPPDSGRVVPGQNLHITLAFLGSLDSEVVRRLRRGAAAITVKPFSLRLQEFGWWPKPRVVWIAAPVVPAPLSKLVTEINALLSAQQIQPDNRPYQPHLTIARKAARKPRKIAFEAIDWQINSFCLVQSTTLPGGAVYEVVETWPLSSN
jgi:2'-5' RNA ligase